MRKVLFVTLVAFLTTSLFYTASAQEKEKKVIDAKASKIENTRGANPNIVTPKPTNDTKAAKPAETRGESCTVYINNNTGYTIDIYVDGNYKGTVGSYSSGYTYAIPGSTKLYAQSVGGTMYWGPTTVDCQYSYTWNLYE